MSLPWIKAITDIRLRWDFGAMNLGEQGAESTLQEEFVGLNFRDTEQPLSYIRQNYPFWTKREIHYRI